MKQGKAGQLQPLISTLSWLQSERGGAMSGHWRYKEGTVVNQEVEQ